MATYTTKFAIGDTVYKLADSERPSHVVRRIFIDDSRQAVRYYCVAKVSVSNLGNSTIPEDDLGTFEEWRQHRIEVHTRAIQQLADLQSP